MSGAQSDPIEEFETILNQITGLVIDSFDAYALLQAKLEQEAGERSEERRGGK